MIITKAMPTPQTATTGVSHPIAAGQGIRSGLCRGPGSVVATVLKSWMSENGAESDTFAVLVRDRATRDRIARGADEV